MFHIFTWQHTLATFHFAGVNIFTPKLDPYEVARICAIASTSPERSSHPRRCPA